MKFLRVQLLSEGLLEQVSDVMATAGLDGLQWPAVHNQMY